MGRGRSSPAGGRWDALLRAHTSQAATNSRTSSSKLGHQKQPTNKLAGPGGSGVAGELAGVTPHENPAPDGLGDEEAVPGSSSRYGLGALSRLNSRFETPSDDPYNPGGRNDGGRVSDLRGMLTLEHSGQSIRPNVLRPGSVGQGEVKPAEQESPTRLLGTQPLRLPDVGEVLVVRPDKHGVLGALQPVSPLLQGSVDSQ